MVAMLSASTVLTVLVLHVNNQSARNCVPWVIRRLVLEWLGTAMGIHTLVKATRRKQVSVLKYLCISIHLL